MKTTQRNKRPPDTLKPEHHEFVRSYVANGGNGTQAYLSAYPRCKYDTARANAPKLLALTCISEALEIEYSKYWKDKNKDIEKSKTYQLIHHCGDVDVADIFNNEYNLKPLNEIPKTARLAIQSIKRTTKTTKFGVDETIEVTLVPKLQALELRAKIQKMIETKIDMAPMEIVILPAERPTDEEDN